MNGDRRGCTGPRGRPRKRLRTESGPSRPPAPGRWRPAWPNRSRAPRLPPRPRRWRPRSGPGPGDQQDLGREAVAVLAVPAPAPGLHLARDVDHGPCRRSWPGGGRTAGGWLRSSCLYRAARRRRRGGPRGKARRPYCRWRPAAARTGCRVPPRSGRDGACGSAPGCCGVWVPGSCRRRSAPRLRLRPVGVDGYDVAVRERAELHDIAVVFEAVSDEMGEECARGAIAACIVPCGAAWMQVNGGILTAIRIRACES